MTKKNDFSSKNCWNIKILYIFVTRFDNQINAQMAESVDALVSNTSRFTPVPVRPRLWVQREVRENFSFFVPFAEVVAPVAVWQSYLWSAIIAAAIFCLCLMIVFENEFSDIISQIQTICDCNRLTSLCSNLLRTFDPRPLRR